MLTPVEVVKALDAFLTKKITFNGLMDLFNTLRMFSDSSIHYALSEYINEEHCEIEEADVMDDVVELHSKISDFDISSVYKFIHHEGGEGQGDSWEQVLQHVESERFMLCEGYYASYHGFDTDGCNYYEVKPVPKEVIDYLPV